MARTSRGAGGGCRSAGILAAAALAVLIAAAALLAAVSYLNLPPDGMAESSLFTVAKGSSGSRVALDLESARLIRSSLFARLFLRLSGEGSRLKSGTYRVERGMSALKIISMMAEGRQATARVTVPEGYTSRQIAFLLESKGVCGADAFLEATGDPAFVASLGIPFPSAEGFLFPDTYDFPLNADPRDAAASMARAFFAEIRNVLPDAPRADSEDFKRDVVLASIIEREYRVESEAPIMSSVFHNRLRIGMPLQSCATVVYVITEIQGKPHPAVLYARDIAMANDYNTYYRPGLPPGPISNPGRTALAAAFMPASTKYLYFRLIDGASGKHFFSETLDEHNRAGTLYTKAAAGKR